MEISEKYKRIKLRSADPSADASSAPQLGDIDWLIYQGNIDFINGFSKLKDRPEIIAVVDKIANLVASQTIKLVENEEDENGNKLGDKRINNGLAAKLDRNPNDYMTRHAFIKNLIYTLYLEGDGNAITLVDLKKGDLTDYVEDVKNGRENYIENLIPVEAGKVTFEKNDGRYKKIKAPYIVMVNGKPIDPANVLHFRIGANTANPWIGRGPAVPLKSVAGNLARLDNIQKEYLTNAYFPSLILKWNVFSGGNSKIGEKMDKLFKGWNKDRKPGDVLNIPSLEAEIEQIKPMPLNDLAIKDGVDIAKNTIATIFGVPLFLTDGSVSFNKDEYNQFINTTIVPLSQMISQELTRKLIIKDNQYIKLDYSKLYKHDAPEIAMLKNLVAAGAISRNELRDKMGLEPSDKEGMNDFITLENYIPVNKLGEQKKLLQGGEKEDEQK